MNQQMLSRLTLVLIGACVVFGLLALAFWLGVGRGYSWLPADPSKAPRLPAVATLKAQDINMPPLGTFAEITERPLFTVDRKPMPPDDSVEADANAEPAPPPVPLQVTLSGVIITPTLKLAMLHNKATNKSVSLREGMPLGGNQAGWTLVKIEPRKVTFSNGSEQDTEVALDVAAKSGGPASRARRAANAVKQAAAKSAKQNDQKQNEQKQEAAGKSLRARIEKRRAELRKQAEKARKAQRQHGKQKSAEKEGKPDTAFLPHPKHHGKNK